MCQFLHWNFRKFVQILFYNTNNGCNWVVFNLNFNPCWEKSIKLKILHHLINFSNLSIVSGSTPPRTCTSWQCRRSRICQGRQKPDMSPESPEPASLMLILTRTLKSHLSVILVERIIIFSKQQSQFLQVKRYMISFFHEDYKSRTMTKVYNLIFQHISSRKSECNCSSGSWW